MLNIQLYGNSLIQGPLLTISCLLACIFDYWLFISSYKAHINAI